MKFDRLYCNGRRDPLGVGTAVTLAWNYAAGGASRTGNRNEAQRAFHVTVTWEGGVWDSGRQESAAMRFCLSDVLPLRPETVYTWKVTAEDADGTTVVSPEQRFETAAGSLDGAAWIGCGTPSAAEDIPAPVFSRVITVPEGINVKRARAYLFGLGLFTCACNGIPCSDHFLMPPNTPYNVRDLFETLDLTPYLHGGDNTVSVVLGNGCNMDYSKYGWRYAQPKGFRGIVKLFLKNGSVLSFPTDGRWTWQDSPVTANGLYAGEIYDARKKDFPAHPAVIAEENAPKGKLIPDEMPPIRVIAEYVPIAAWETEDGRVYDFGRNLQGVVRLNVRASAGTRISLHTSEMLFPDGRPEFTTNRAARSEDIYVCAGDGDEEYTPHFTYHGFRYAAVTVADGEAEELAVTALFLSADVEEGSTFSSSDPHMNRSHDLARHSIRCNYVSIPTDCPVRDERTPCQMDSQMMEAAAMCNYHMEAYYRKWLDDITCSPRSPGSGNPDWYGDYIMLAWRLYHFYGDEKPLVSLFPQILADIDAWMSRDGGVITDGFGDWCLPNDNTWEGYGQCKTAVNTCLLFSYCRIAEETARELLHDEAAAALCREHADTIRRTFCERYIHEDGSVDNGRQTNMVLPLYYGMLDEDPGLREKVRAALCRRVKEDGCVDTGGFGTGALIPALLSAGGGDLIPGLFSRRDYPGFGYWLAEGATSLWEQWAVRGSMHSHSHGMHAGFDASFYRTLCGVTAVGAGFSSFRVAPCLPESMTFAECTMKTASGDIGVRFERLYGGCELYLRVPPNTTAYVELPRDPAYADCGLWDGERRMERTDTDTLTLGSGVYQLRLVPEPAKRV